MFGHRSNRLSVPPTLIATRCQASHTAPKADAPQQRDTHSHLSHWRPQHGPVSGADAERRMPRQPRAEPSTPPCTVRNSRAS
eukprot:scaffold15422_cov107-Isochrysis_galbana.AAC.7